LLLKPFAPSDSIMSSAEIDLGHDGELDKREQSNHLYLANESPVYHYLTFDTELPPPSLLIVPDSNRQPPPEPPDLRRYVSPFTWSESRKTVTLWVSCAVTVVTAYTAGSYAAAVSAMSEEWNVSEEAAYAGITMFTTGFAIAPMVLAPISEINGRYPVFVATGILFVVCQLGCALTQSYAGMLVARFFGGVGGSTFSTMVGGVVSDIYHAQDRNTPMALFTGAAFLGTGLGPLCSGFLAQNVHWRWVFYTQVITCGVCILAVILFFKETRGNVLLSRRAHILNAWYEALEEAGYVGVMMPGGADGSKMRSQRIRWKVKSDEERESLAKMIGISLYRPFRAYLQLYPDMTQGF
jgi:multidrug resistance protein